MFAKNLKKVMEEKGISAAELSRLTGYSKSAISQYLSGAIAKPAWKKMEAIAVVLGVMVEELTAAPVQKPTALPYKCTIQPHFPRKATLTCKEAAALLHKREDYIRLGLQQGRPGFEYGSAVKTSGKWSYCIYANKFTEITGIPVGEGK